MALDIEDAGELEAAELQASSRRAATPGRHTLTPGLGHAMWLLAPLTALLACVSQGAGFYAGFDLLPFFYSSALLVPLAIGACLAAGEFGGPRGRIIGVVCGVCLVPPVSLLVAWLPWTLLGSSL